MDCESVGKPEQNPLLLAELRASGPGALGGTALKLAGWENPGLFRINPGHGGCRGTKGIPT